ncbi:unnamed protein product [Choristocarpus tenellus]
MGKVGKMGAPGVEDEMKHDSDLYSDILINRKTDIFYIDPSMEDAHDLSIRAAKMGIRTRSYLGEGVTVCVTCNKAKKMKESRGRSMGRRRDRIHRMVCQAQSESGARVLSLEDRARELEARVETGVAFQRWLGDLECAQPGSAQVSKGRNLVQGLPRAKHEVREPKVVPRNRFRSPEHPCVVIKDLDGLEADQVQSFPPELRRKCILHNNAPPGICPFTPVEQWDREVSKQKQRRDRLRARNFPARSGMVPPQRSKRGGWCECCKVRFTETEAEHCASDQHRSFMENDANFAALMRFDKMMRVQRQTKVGKPPVGGSDEHGDEVASQGCQGMRELVCISNSECDHEDVKDEPNCCTSSEEVENGDAETGDCASRVAPRDINHQLEGVDGDYPSRIQRSKKGMVCIGSWEKETEAGQSEHVVDGGMRTRESEIDLVENGQDCGKSAGCALLLGRQLQPLNAPTAEGASGSHGDWSPSEQMASGAIAASQLVERYRSRTEVISSHGAGVPVCDDNLDTFCDSHPQDSTTPSQHSQEQSSGSKSPVTCHGVQSLTGNGMANSFYSEGNFCPLAKKKVVPTSLGQSCQHQYSVDHLAENAGFYLGTTSAKLVNGRFQPQSLVEESVTENKKKSLKRARDVGLTMMVSSMTSQVVASGAGQEAFHTSQGIVTPWQQVDKHYRGKEIVVESVGSTLGSSPGFSHSAQQTAVSGRPTAEKPCQERRSSMRRNVPSLVSDGGSAPTQEASRSITASGVIPWQKPEKSHSREMCSEVESSVQGNDLSCSGSQSDREESFITRAEGYDGASMQTRRERPLFKESSCHLLERRPAALMWQPWQRSMNQSFQKEGVAKGMANDWAASNSGVCRWSSPSRLQSMGWQSPGRSQDDIHEERARALSQVVGWQQPDLGVKYKVQRSVETNSSASHRGKWKTGRYGERGGSRGNRRRQETSRAGSLVS